MSGKPASRIGDAVDKGVIVQGSATVLIGDIGGVAPGRKVLGNETAPGSFAPLIRIEQNRHYMLKEEEQKSERERAMQEALKQVEPDDWGAVRNEKTFLNSCIRQPIRFQGQWLDEESGVYYNRYRFYDPRQRRYTTQDPIGLEGEMNFYAYVGGDPVRFTGPLGLYKVHGNWCGPDWTGGRRNQYRPAPQGYYKPPICHTDAACERHDKCFTTCRDLNPCDKDARSACMSECNADLKSALRSDSSSGTSIAVSTAISVGMTISPDPGPNSPSCGCAK